MASAFHESSEFALVAAEKIARYLGAWSEEMGQAFDDVRKELVFMMYEIVAEHRARKSGL